MRSLLPVLASSLLLLLALGSLVHAQAPPSSDDPCAVIGSKDFGTLEEVYGCYRLFAASSDFKQDHVQALKRFIEVYPFTDLNVDTSSPLFPNKVDIAAQLDALAADTAVQTQFEFFSKIMLLVRSLQDAHFSYRPLCVSTFDFFQPWHLAAVFPETGGVGVKIVDTLLKRTVIPFWESALGGPPLGFVNYTVKSIDGVDAVRSWVFFYLSSPLVLILTRRMQKAIQDFADKFAGFSRSPESRFNRVLYRRVYQDGVWTGRSGSFYYTTFLGHDASPNRTYVLTPPNGDADVTVSIPWAAAPTFSSFAGRADYERFYCNLLSSSNLRRRDVGSLGGVLEDLPHGADAAPPGRLNRPLPNLDTVPLLSASI
ncbi:hypothetical protein HDU67_003764, partial [Dinochytrium kinnereticum]